MRGEGYQSVLTRSMTEGRRLSIAYGETPIGLFLIDLFAPYETSYDTGDDGNLTQLFNAKMCDKVAFYFRLIMRKRPEGAK